MSQFQMNHGASTNAHSVFLMVKRTKRSREKPQPYSFCNVTAISNAIEFL